MGFIRDYHIIIVPKDKSKTRTVKISAFTLKVILLTLVISVPLFFVAVMSTIHYQNKVVVLTQSSFENKQLVENKKELIIELARLEKAMDRMDDSISHLSEVMDIDPQSLKFGTGPISDLDSATLDEDESIFSIPETEEAVEDWVDQNGPLTMNKFNKKVTFIEDEASILNKRLEEIFSQNRYKINFVTATPSLIPVDGWITSEFGIRYHPISRRTRMHEGIDIASPSGTIVKAPASGRVVFSGRSGGYGNMLVVDHGYGICTLYGHLSQFQVKKGEFVKRGDIIGAVGSSGYTTGSHLHYEIQVDGIPSDPLVFIVQ